MLHHILLTHSTSINNKISVARQRRVKTTLWQANGKTKTNQSCSVVKLMPMAVMLCSQGLLTTALLLTGGASSLYRMITKGFTIALVTRFCMVSIGWYRLYLSGYVCCESQLWANTKHTECSKIEFAAMSIMFIYTADKCDGKLPLSPELQLLTRFHVVLTWASPLWSTCQLWANMHMHVHRDLTVMGKYAPWNAEKIEFVQWIFLLWPIAIQLLWDELSLTALQWSMWLNEACGWWCNTLKGDSYTLFVGGTEREFILV